MRVRYDILAEVVRLQIIQNTLLTEIAEKRDAVRWGEDALDRGKHLRDEHGLWWDPKPLSDQLGSDKEALALARAKYYANQDVLRGLQEKLEQLALATS